MTFLTLEAWTVSLASTYSVFSDDSCIIQGFCSQTVNKHGHITCNGEISRGFELSHTWYESQLSHLPALRLWRSNWSCLASVLLSVGWWYIYGILPFWELRWCMQITPNGVCDITDTQWMLVTFRPSCFSVFLFPFSTLSLMRTWNWFAWICM